MAIDLTPAQFKEMKPAFAGLSDAVVQMYLDAAQEVVDESWGEASARLGLAAYACHLMTLDGLGTSAEAKGFLKGTAGYQTIKSADVTLTRFARETTKSEYSEWLGQTQCGAAYQQMVRRLRGGMRVLAVGCDMGVSPYAKDWPRIFHRA